MKKLIAKEHIPTKIIPTVVLYVTALSYWQAPEWLWGVSLSILVLIILSNIKDLMEGISIYSIEESEIKETKKTKKK